jgi:hypothetical protein
LCSITCIGRDRRGLTRAAAEPATAMSSAAEFGQNTKGTSIFVEFRYAG